MWAIQLLRLHSWPVVLMSHWGPWGIHGHTGTRQNDTELLRGRQHRGSLWSWPIWLLHMLLRSCLWPAHQLFPKLFLLICLPLMRILKAKYFLPLPFSQLTVTVTSCRLGGVMRRLEGGSYLRFSSLIRAERRKHPVCATWSCLSAQCFSVRMSHARGHGTGTAKPDSCSSVPSWRWTNFCTFSLDLHTCTTSPIH